VEEAPNINVAQGSTNDQHASFNGKSSFGETEEGMYEAGLPLLRKLLHN
jgi:hypothetical protein